MLAISYENCIIQLILDNRTKYCQKKSGVVLKSSFWSNLHF